MKQNRIISISSRLIEFWCFGLLVALGVGGLGGCGWGWLGGAPTHVHMHAHARTHTHAHACMVNMIIPCKWLPPLDFGKSQGFPMMSYVYAHVCMCMHVHACACVWGTLSPPSIPIHPHPTPQGGGPPESVKIQ